MNEVHTIVEALARRAQTQGECVAYRCLLGPEQCPVVLSYAQLQSRARARARMLVGLHLSGERVLLPAQAHPAFLEAFFACLIARAVPVMAFTPRTHRRAALKGIAQVATPAALLAGPAELTQFRRRAPQLGLASEIQFHNWDAPPVAGATEALPQVQAQDLAFLQFSSGSTGTPKGIEVRHENLVANLARQAEALGHPTGAPIVSWLPLHHDMGLVGQMLWGLFIGAPVTLMSPMHFFEKPLRWLQAISRYGAYTAGGPNFSYQACVDSIDPAQVASLDLSSWKVAFNGAEPVRMSTMQDFARHFADAGFSRRAFVPSYGLAESCVFVCADGQGARDLALDRLALRTGRVQFAAPHEASQSVVCCGAPVLGDEIQIQNPQSGEPVLPGQVGEIVVRGPSVCRGYWNNPQASAQSFIQGDSSAFNQLRTGDLGFVHEGQLYVTGRIKDLIIARGQNLYPQDLESVLQGETCSVHLGMHAAIGREHPEGEQPWMVCELTRAAMSSKPDFAQLSLAIRTAVGRHTGVDLAGVVLTRPASVPRTSSGKVQRRRCALLLEQGELKVVHEVRFAPGASPFAAEADATSPIEQLQAFVRQRVGEGSLAGRSAFELGLGSLDCAILAQELRQAWGFDFALAGLMDAPDLQAWVQAQVGPAPQRVALPVDLDAYPASPGQAAIWAVHQNAADPSVYNVHLVLNLRGAMSRTQLKAAFAELRSRHPVLRTRIEEQQGGLRARVQNPEQGSLDWQSVAGSASPEVIDAMLHEPFDLATQDPMRVRHLAETEQQGATLVWVMHHIAVDFWSLVVLVRELLGLLSPQQSIAAAPAFGYAQWQAQLAAKIKSQGAADWAYWSQTLGGELPTEVLPLDRPRTESSTHRGAYHHVHLCPELVRGLDRIAKARKVTRYRLYLALFGLALARQGGRQDLVVGTPITGRDDGRWRDVVGYFVNPAAIRIRISDHDTLGSFIDQVAHRVKEALDHRVLPFAQIVERLAPVRSSRSWPLYQVAFTYQQSHDPELSELAALALQDGEAKLDWGALSLSHAQIQGRVENFDLKLVMADRKDEVLAAFQYDTSVLALSSVQALAQTWLALARAWVEAPLELALDELRVPPNIARPAASGPFLNSAEHVALSWARLPKAGCAIEGLARNYDRQALDRWSASLVAQMQARGLCRGQRVGIELPMSPEFVVAALASLRMGLTYVPIDPRYPASRRELIYQDAQLAGVWSCDSSLNEPGCTKEPPRWVVGDCPSQAPLPEFDLPQPHRDEIAYLVYTSGSTGRPKGVEVSHGALLRLVDWHHQRYETGVQTRVAPTASVGFDASAWELWPHLLGGATLVIPPEGLVREPAPFLRWLAQKRIDTLFLATALIEALLQEAHWPEALELRHLLTGGDRLGPVQAQLKARGLVLHNHYGPTEAAVVATAGAVDVQGIGRPSIGHPLPGMGALVLNRRCQRVSPGAVGDLYLSGPQLAQGYAHNPRATAECFIPHPYGAPGERMYHTGDRVRATSEGQLLFEGRSDAQIQIRGQRVEPGEVQAQLCADPRVQSAKVVVQRSEGKAPFMVAYVVPTRTQADLSPDFERAQVQDWQELYDQTYQALGPDGGLNHDEQDLVGWQESAHGQAICPEEMWRWVQDSVQTIEGFSAQEILEVGAGSGLLAKALAPKVKRYWASDLSNTAVEHLESWAKASGCTGLSAVSAAAHEVLDHPDLQGGLATIDTVVLNSVLQYFPSSNYALALVQALMKRLPGLKQIYLGDLRDASLLDLFHQQNAWARAGQRQTLHAVVQAATRLVALDRELCVAPSWWSQRFVGWRATCHLRPGDYDNELSRYRYDLVLSRSEQLSSPSWENWDLQASKDPLAELESRLASVRGPIRVRGLLDARLRTALALDTQLHQGDAQTRAYRRVEDVGPLLAASEDTSRWCWPHDLLRRARAAGLAALMVPASDRQNGGMELWLAPTMSPLRTDVPWGQDPQTSVVHEPWWSRTLSELPAKLMAKLSASLPAAMVPRALFAVPHWPTTAHGKLDRKALPLPGAQDLSQQHHVEPQGAAQRLLHDVFCEVLGLAEVGAQQNFFSLGGDSILAIQIASKVRARGWSLASSQVLDHPSIEQLAPYLVKQRPAPGPLPDTQPQQAPLTAMQKGLWIEQDGAQDSYVETLRLRFEGSLDPQRLKAAWVEVLSRHDALRCVFTWDSAGGTQRAVPVEDLELDWKEEPVGASGVRVPLDLSRAPVMRWRLQRGGPQTWELHWTHAHLLLDGWSVALVVAQLLECYVAPSAQTKRAFAKTPSYLSYAQSLAQTQSAPSSAAYWRKLASSWQAAQSGSTLQTRKAPAQRLCLTLDDAQARAIKAAAATAETTVSTLVLTAWIEIWTSIRGRDAAAIGVVDAGRDAAVSGIESMVGLLIQSIPLVVSASPDEADTWSARWCQRAQALRAAKQAAQGQSFTALARWLGADRGGELWDCLVAVENYPRDAGVGPVEEGLALTSVSHSGSTHYPLTLVVGVHEGMSIQLEIDPLQIDADQAQEWMEALAQLLAFASQNPQASVQEARDALDLSPLRARASASESSTALSASTSGAEPQMVADLWAQVMQRGAVEPDEDFFALGGDSIVAMTLVQALRAQGWDCTVQTLMAERTPRALAGKLVPLHPEHSGAQRPDQEPEGPIGLLPIQCWLLGQGLVAPYHFNQALRLPAPAGIKPETLAAALQTLAGHHSALRCNLVGDGPNNWSLSLTSRAEGRWPLHQLDLRGLSPALAQDKLRERCQALQSGFDLYQGPLFVGLWVQWKTRTELVLIAHHLVVDAVSWRVLMGDLQALLTYPEKPLAPVTASLGRWACALQRYGEGPAQVQRSHWNEPVWTQVCPWLGAHDAGSVLERRYLQGELDKENTARLLGEGTQLHRATLQELLLASFARSLRAFSVRDAIIVDVEGHGRYESVLGLCVDRSIGWFTTQCPVRILCQEKANWQVQCEQAKRALREIADHGLGYGALRLREEVPASKARVSWNYLGQVDARFAGASSMLGGSIEADPVIGRDHGASNRCAYVVDLNLSLVDGALLIHIAYGPSLEPGHIASWLETWLQDLAQLAQLNPGETTPAQLSDFDLMLGELDEGDLAAIVDKVERS